MKNVLSLLSLAALALAFAAGCGGGHTECKQAKEQKDCEDKSKFEKDKGFCKWDDTATTDKCIVFAWVAHSDATTSCATHNAAQATCDAAPASVTANALPEQKKINDGSGKTGVCKFANAACTFIEKL